jgi:hypothetical protein
MAALIRGWVESDGAISHAVDPETRGETLCGMPDPNTRDDPADSWAAAPSPRCTRCQEAIAPGR